MAIVFVVTSGDYSDYTIEGIFTTKPKAERFITIKASSDECEINEWELDIYPDRFNGLFMYEGLIWLDSGNCQIRESNPKRNFRALGDLVETNTAYKYFITYVLARDIPHAKKITRDRYAVAKAQREGLT